MGESEGVGVAGEELLARWAVTMLCCEYPLRIHDVGREKDVRAGLVYAVLERFGVWREKIIVGQKVGRGTMGLTTTSHT